jgi:2-polyprenyl-6-hydroxyphenyl methylase/3-demethylubiquinone-9 3-methyltransferase
VEETPAASADSSQETRFAFGKNWIRYLEGLTEQRIESARRSLADFAGCDRLRGSFLDIGCGSGLFSLAALRLGAERLVSFDYDAQSVEACRRIKQRFAPGAPNWQIVQGSALDEEFLKRLGCFDFVYSWGVLHHTGRMWDAIALAADRVVPGGTFFIAIYNTYSRSNLMLRVKRFYCRSSLPVRKIMEVLYAARSLAMYLAKLRNPFREIRQYGATSRGMSWWRDRVDWVGGYPYEHALPEEVFRFVASRRFELINLKTCNGGKGCNEFLFRRKVSDPGRGS